MPKASSSTSSSSKQPRSAKESTRSSTRRSQSADIAQTNEQQSPNAQQVSKAKQDMMVAEDEKSAAVTEAKREEVAVVAPPRGRGRPRKVQPVVEAPIAAAPVPVAKAVVTQPQVDKESEADGGESEVARESSHADADIVDLIVLQAEGRNADVGDADAALDDGGVIAAEESSGGGDADADQKADEEKKDEPKSHEEAREETSQETNDDISSAPAKTNRKSSRLSSNASENGSTASMNVHEAKPASKSRKRLLEELHQDPEAQAPLRQQAESTKKKRKQEVDTKISPSSSRNLFQFTCKLLESQKLEYEVRAREFEEKIVLMAAKRAKWEKKIRSVKRQLSAYGHPVDAVVDETGTVSTNGSGLNGSSTPDSRHRADPLDLGMAATSTALTTTTTGGFASTTTSSGSSTSLTTMRDAFSSRMSFTSGVNSSGRVDSLLPVSIQNLEAQIRDTLGSRAQLVQDMMKDLQGMRGLNDKITRLR